jgi:hypothetical protein
LGPLENSLFLSSRGSEATEESQKYEILHSAQDDKMGFRRALTLLTGKGVTNEAFLPIIIK